jgi:hypothetical protein
LIPNYSDELNKIAEEKFIKINGNYGWDFQPGEFKLNNNFALKKGGLLFMFNSYEIGTYAAGNPQVFIPYHEIKKLIKSGSLLWEIIQK